jgi:hypothetical protein
MQAMGKKSLATALRVLLEITWYATIVALVAVAVEAVLAVAGNPAAARLDFAVPLRLDPATYAIESARLGLESARIRGAEATLAMHSASRLLVVTWLAMALLWTGGMLVVIQQLRRIFDTLESGDPFILANAARLRLIGLVVIAFDVGRAVVSLLQSLYLRRTLTTSGIAIGVEVSLTAEVIFLGLALLVVAEVFRLGAALRDDQALTV